MVYLALEYCYSAVQCTPSTITHVTKKEFFGAKKPEFIKLDRKCKAYHEFVRLSLLETFMSLAFN